MQSVWDINLSPASVMNNTPTWKPGKPIWPKRNRKRPHHATRHNTSRPTHAPSPHGNYRIQSQNPHRRSQNPPHRPERAKVSHGARGCRQGRGRLGHAHAPPARLRRGRGVGRQHRRLPALHPRRAGAARRGRQGPHARPDRSLPRPRRRPRPRGARLTRRVARPLRQRRRRRRAQSAVRQRRVGRRRDAPQGRLRRRRLRALPRPGAPGVLQGHARGSEDPDQPVVRERDGGPDQGPPAPRLRQQRDTRRPRERALLQGRLAQQVRRPGHAGRHLLPAHRRPCPRAVHVERQEAVHRMPLRLQGAEASVRAWPRATELLHVHLPPERAPRPAQPAAQAWIGPGAARGLHVSDGPGPRRRLQAAQVHHTVQHGCDGTAASPRAASAVPPPRRLLGYAGFIGVTRHICRLPPVLRRSERGRDRSGRGDRHWCHLWLRGGEHASRSCGLRRRPPIHVLDQGGPQRRGGFHRASCQSFAFIDQDVGKLSILCFHRSGCADRTVIHLFVDVVT